MHRPARPTSLVLLALAALLLAGCGGSDSSSEGGATAASDVAPDAAPADGAAERAAGGSATGGEPGTASLGRVSVDGTAVVHTGEIGVRVDDLRTAADRAGQIARDAGGVVAAERADTARAGGYADAELVLRVPPETFDDVLARLAGLGDERARSVSSEPVGEELVDLESRLASQRASVERVRGLLAEATDLEQVVRIEAELTRRTADLESLAARLAALQDRIDLSTITLRLDTEGAPAEDEALPGFLDGLRGGWGALLAAGTVLGATTGALLPFLPLLALAALGVHRARRMRAARSGEGSGHGASGVQPA